MTWGAVAVTVASAAGGYLASQGGAEQAQAYPGMQTSPLYSRATSGLVNLGEQIFSGNLPDYYKEIGEIGGETFEDYLKKVKGDIQTTVQEDLAKRGITRGGIGTRAVTKTLADIIPGLRESERERALTSRLNLLTQGKSMLSDVAGLSTTRDVQSYEGAIQSERLRREEQRQNEQEFLEQIMSGSQAGGQIGSSFVDIMNSIINKK